MIYIVSIYLKDGSVHRYNIESYSFYAAAESAVGFLRHDQPLLSSTDISTINITAL